MFPKLTKERVRKFLRPTTNKVILFFILSSLIPSAIQYGIQELLGYLGASPYLYILSYHFITPGEELATDISKFTYAHFLKDLPTEQFLHWLVIESWILEGIRYLIDCLYWYFLSCCLIGAYRKVVRHLKK